MGEGQADRGGPPAWRRSGAKPGPPPADRPPAPSDEPELEEHTSVQPRAEPDEPPEPAGSTQTEEPFEADLTLLDGGGPEPSGEPDEPFGEPADMTLYQTSDALAADASSIGAEEGTLLTEGARLPAEPRGDALDGEPDIPGVSVVREIGRGGVGVVYEGTQGYLDRRVAVKVLLSRGAGSENFNARFQREAKILASLSHRNVVSCYQAGVAPDGRCFLVMEYIDGPTLAQWIGQHGALDPARSARICRAVAKALAYAHESGIIHRDVKPPNVLLKRAAGPGADADFPFEPMLADLGLARSSRELPGGSGASGIELTVQGAVMGSPPTMAPEQFDDPDSVDFRTDIYGLGCVLFQCLTGTLAFPQGSLTSLIAAKTRGEAPDPRALRPQVPPALAELVRSMLARKREDRPASYDELLRRLEGPFTAPLRRRSRAPWLAAAAVGVALAGWLVASRPGAAPGSNSGAAPGSNSGAAPGSDSSGSADSQSGGTPGGEPIARAQDPLPPSIPDVGRGGTSAAGEPDGPATEGGAPGTPKIEHDALDERPEGEGAGADVLEDHESPEQPALAVDGVPEEPPRPVLVLPELEPIAPGEAREWLRDGASAAGGWKLVGASEVWGLPEDSTNGAAVFDFEGRSSATHALPAPPWKLAGRAELVRPEMTATRRLSIVVELGEPHGIALRQGVANGGVGLEGSLVRRSAGGGWEEALALPELSIGEVDLEAYQAAGSVDFQVDWNGELLSITWGLAGDPARGSAQLSSFELVELGAPRRLCIELEAGVAALRDLVIEGR